MVGGEAVTEGLKARYRELLGQVTFVEGYAMTETGRCAMCENAGRVSRHAPFLRMYNGTAARLSPVGREQGGA